MKSKIALITIILSTALSGCGKTTTINIEIQPDGKPYLIPYSEYNDTTTHITYSFNITEKDLLQEIKYFDGRFEYQYEKPWNEIKEYIDFIKEKNGVVSGEQYPYIVVIPITADKEIKPKKTNGQQRVTLERCISKYAIENDSFIEIPKGENPEIEDDIYHYKLYVNYNIAASRMLLNNISDLCISYYDYDGPSAGVYLSENSYVTQTNTLTIPAQDIKDALDYWNIPYDL